MNEIYVTWIWHIKEGKIRNLSVGSGGVHEVEWTFAEAYHLV
jgi:hypothetical protein